MASPLVIVESPAKARTIEKFLGSGFKVAASIGHIRDLPGKAAEVPAWARGKAWARLGVDVESDFRPVYIVPAEKRAQVQKLKELLRGADALYLATDEDREGESISWHLLEELKPKVPVHRLVFHEITREAIQAALRHPRQLDSDLVRAQETRRVVDRLYGYEVSPLLWKKVRPKLSAGRVQSVAVRLLVERERARMAFRAATWWDVLGVFAAGAGSFPAELAELDGRPIARGKDFDERGGLKAEDGRVVLDEATARGLVERLQGQAATVEGVESRPTTDRPAPPFTTSTLQQEANRKLRWTARRTMTVAQQLYETGWITYMRTDSTTLSDEALRAARELIAAQYGADYLPAQPRVYRNKVKNAQEAHEAIRPAGTRFRSLEEARRELEADAARLYELIWKRTVACQMADARGSATTARVQMGTGADRAIFVASGKTIHFPGYRRAYVEGSDVPEGELAEQERILPAMQVGERLRTETLEARGHETRPPPRLTEASLVKEMEARGIGRPSTYASIIDTILRREYVFKKGNALVPTFTAFAVTGLLEAHLGWLVDYEFTARMEEQLDEIARGEAASLDYLRAFYQGERGLTRRLQEAEGKIDPREVCSIPIGQASDGEPLLVRIGRFGPFLTMGEARADIPEDLPPDELTPQLAMELIGRRREGPTVLGSDPATGEPVLRLHGRFGPYVQLGEVVEGQPPPRRASLLPGMSEESVDLVTALRLLSLPRTLGVDPQTGEEVVVSNGRFGPYLRRGKTSRSLPPGVSALDIALEDALRLLATAPARRGPEPIARLGVDPRTGRELTLMKGRFGPYVTDGETNASLPKGADPLLLDLAGAAELIQAREGAPKKPGRRPPTRKARPTAAEGGAAAGTASRRGTAAPTRGGARATSTRTSKAGTSKAGTSKAGTAKAGKTKAGTAETSPKRKAVPKAADPATEGAGRGVPKLSRATSSRRRGAAKGGAEAETPGDGG